MRIEYHPVRIGEWLGPVDPDYDWFQHASPKGPTNPEVVERGRKVILALQKAWPDSDSEWHFHSEGDGRFPIVQVGMYDGWPYWRPTPSIAYIGPLGGREQADFMRVGGRIEKG